MTTPGFGGRDRGKSADCVGVGDNESIHRSSAQNFYDNTISSSSNYLKQS
jgi:hypothetical protein